MSNAISAARRATQYVSIRSHIGTVRGAARRPRPGHPLVRRFWAIWLRLYRIGPRPTRQPLIHL
jgi:hypothetical protein